MKTIENIAKNNSSNLSSRLLDIELRNPIFFSIYVLLNITKIFQIESGSLQLKPTP
ncbi:hypothetical protein GXM_07956 [Nostoc sphaeroides CCNUC1]|uniref:Uncharacterized protein n=1 Tax=Nostoc sphaeroides CCNUC1 TaxID=2653204 RepID=A0A5P8WD29_9NOSO|nr:hypothetical protein GXM_07956 [Nostoc sphaeroides CCNUC1]